MAAIPVGQGETWQDIATRLGISVTRLQSWNQGADAPGDTVNVANSFYAELQKSGVGTTDPDDLAGVLRGGTTVRLRYGTGGISDDIYYQIYEFPAGSGKFVAYRYNGLEQVKAALGTLPDITTRTQSWWDSRIMAEGAAEEVIGQAGETFSHLTERMMTEAAQAAGLSDPSMVGKMVSNPEMQQVMAQAVIGDWTPEQIKAAQRNTSYWKEELYPGIEKFYGQTSEPERAWVDYRDNVAPTLRMLGYTPDANGTFNAQVGEMLNKGIADDTFLQMAPTFVQAEQNSRFAGVLGEWTQRTLGRTVEFGEWFDLLAGGSDPELRTVAEQAMLAYEAQESSAGLVPSQIENLASRTDLSADQAAQLFSEFNQAVLSLGESGLTRGGLTRDEVLSAAAGLNPESGRSVEEVRLAVAKLAQENDLFDEEKVSFYVGFNPQGQPTRPGLASLRPESA